MKHAAIILLLTMNAQAGEVEISWSLPTHREDGTALDISEIAGTNFVLNYGGEIRGPYLIPIFVTSFDVLTSPVPYCLELSTLLFSGLISAPLDELCVSNSPEGEGQ